ncbi:MAG: HAMP domain-containing protein, partial [Ottowia sp.]|nr:HAMP domain-containing protein [Ottowia sp.]
GLLAWLRPPYGFVWMLALAGLAVMAALFPVARRLTRRLVSLQHGVQRWGEGDLSVRVPASGSDEVADLTRHFNTAADRIETLMGEQAALLASQKSLLANASHELRSPLARIRMALELMPSAGEPGALPARTRTELARNVAELDALVEEILLASRLEAREADLGSVEEVELLALLAEESARVGAAFEPDTGAGEVLVRGVPRLLRRAVRNLLENAVRYGRSVTAIAAAQAEPVLVRLVPAGRDVEIVVGDRGPGVPPAQRERIFEPFYRLPGASEREGGVGLGLALVRQIAER